MANFTVALLFSFSLRKKNFLTFLVPSADYVCKQFGPALYKNEKRFVPSRRVVQYQNQGGGGGGAMPSHPISDRSRRSRYYFII